MAIWVKCRSSLLCAGISAVLLTAGCSGLLADMTADISYSPAGARTAFSAPSIYLHASDERRSPAVGLHTNFSMPVLNMVNAAIASPLGEERRETLVTPLRAVQLALAARLNSMGHPVYMDKKDAQRAAARMVLYLYTFEVDFSEERFSRATVALALGKIPGDAYAVDRPVTPEAPVDPQRELYAPICSSSVGMGTAPVLTGNNKRAADISLSRALGRAVGALDLKGCM